MITRNLYLKPQNCLWVILLLSLLGCAEVKDLGNAAGADDFPLDEAISFYEKDLMSESETRSASKKTLWSGADVYVPNWTKAVYVKTPKWECYNVPITMMSYMYRATVSWDKDSAQVNHPVPVTQKLLVIKNNGRLSRYIMTLIPTVKYNAENNGDVSDKFFYGNENTDFSGYVIYANAKTNAMTRLERYEDGKNAMRLTIVGEGWEYLNKIKKMESVLQKIRIEEKKRNLRIESFG